MSAFPVAFPDIHWVTEEMLGEGEMETRKQRSGVVGTHPPVDSYIAMRDGYLAYRVAQVNK